MKRWQICLLIGLVAALAVHFTVLHKIPSMIMTKAQARFEESGVALNQWVAAPRITPQTQSVVRPSPDLAYAICRFDVSDGPIMLSAPGWDGTGSLSVFDARTNNVFVARFGGADGEGISVIAALPGTVRPEDRLTYEDSATPVIELKGLGLALIRRLAPDEPARERAAILVEQAYCGPAPGGK